MLNLYVIRKMSLEQVFASSNLTRPPPPPVPSPEHPECVYLTYIIAKVKGCVRFLLIVVLLLSLSMHCASALHAFFSSFAPALTYLSFFADSDCLEIPMPHMSSLLSCIMSDGILYTFAASHGLLRSLCHMSYKLSSCLAGYTLHPPISSPCSLIVS